MTGGLFGAAWRQRFRATPSTAAATPVLILIDALFSS